jgi:hypothetical protein
MNKLLLQFFPPYFNIFSQISTNVKEKFPILIKYFLEQKIPSQLYGILIDQLDDDYDDDDDADYEYFWVLYVSTVGTQSPANYSDHC